MKKVFLFISISLFTHLFSFSQSVGIGSTQFVPSGMLEVRGIDALSTSYALKIRNSALSEMMVIRNDGRIGIGTATPGTSIHLYAGPPSFRMTNGTFNSYSISLSSGGTQISCTDAAGWDQASLNFVTANADCGYGPCGGSEIYGLKISGAISGVGGYAVFGSSTVTNGIAFESRKDITAIGGIARGAQFLQTLTASANNDVITAMRIAPTFTNGAFTGVKNYGLLVETGNVGIGTNNPSVQLEVAQTKAIKLGDAFMSSGPNGYAHFAYNAWHNNVAWQIPNAGAKSSLVQMDGANIHFWNTTANGLNVFTERMLIDPNGRAGVNTASNTHNVWLQVGGANPYTTTAAYENIFKLQSNDLDIAGVGQPHLQMRMGIKTDATAANRYAGIEVEENGTYQVLAMQMNGGNVGIGTTVSPARLTVYGNYDPTALVLSGNSTKHASWGVGRTAREANFGIAGDNFGTGIGDYSGIATTGDAVLRTLTEDLVLDVGNTTGSIRFATGAVTLETEKMTLTNAGDLMFGTTSGNYARLYVGGDQVTTKRQFAVNSWADISANGCGPAVFGGNMFTDNSACTFKYSNTHGSIGGIGFAVNYPGWDQASVISSNTTASTALTAFAPLAIMTFNYDGKVGVGCNAPAYTLDVRGTFGASTSITSPVINTAAVALCSDIRYKKDIIPLASSLEKINLLNGVNYFWKQNEFQDKNFNNRKQIGFIAQDLEKIFPELVFTDDKGYKSVDYSKLTPILVEALKEQQKMILELTKRITILETQGAVKASTR